MKMTKQEIKFLRKTIIDRDIKDKEEWKLSRELIKKCYEELTAMGYEIAPMSNIDELVILKAEEVFGKEAERKVAVNKPIKIKKYGKNLKSLERLMKIESTKVYFNGREAKGLFEKLIGFEFMFKPCKCGFEATGPDGESFKIETTQILEFV